MSALPWPMNFMLSTDAVVCCALAATFIFLLRRSASPAPSTMYTPPVPPVTMFSVLPVKSGAADAAPLPDAAGEDVAVVARGAAHAVASRIAMSGTTRISFIWYLRTRGSLGRGRTS